MAAVATVALDDPPGAHTRARAASNSAPTSTRTPAPTPTPTPRPSVKLHIPFDAAPAELHDGLRQLARHHIRRDTIRFCERIGHGWVPAGGSRDPTTGKGQRSEWWWNVAFVKDGAMAPRSLAISTSAPSFAPTPPQTPVQEPYVVTVRYHRPCEAFRALGHVLGATRSLLRPSAQASPEVFAHPTLLDATEQWALDPLAAHEALSGHAETAQFDTLGTMIDVSRNGVLNLPSVRFLCRKLALWGYNMLQLYTEDTYQIEGEPFFGYLRGGYTQAELREIDDYAHALGIECVPCIQTLGHLGQVLQWPRFLALRDTTEVLLAELPETYVMLEKMISTATAPFRSKRIHLGQDETHGLGHGRYHAIFGQYDYKDPTRIFIEHLNRVHAICRGLQLQPMIWSDMLFCLDAKNNSLLGYYDSHQPSAPAVQGLPPEIDLVYWDYYHLRAENYAARIASHKQLNGGKAPWMAAGSWTWTRFWTALPFTFATCRASQNACKAPGSGVRNVFLTIWGDEGNEVDLWSSLPAWAYYADHGYTPRAEVDIAALKAKYDGITAGSFDDFVLASRLDDPTPEVQTLDDRVHFSPNTSKWMMWEEPFFGFVTPSVRAAGLDLAGHYADLAAYLEHRLGDTRDGEHGHDDVDADIDADGDAPPRTLATHPFNARLRFPQLIASALAIKASLREDLSRAYTAGDLPALRRLASPRDPSAPLSRLRRTVEQAHAYHREMWMSMYKPFGWETVDLRWGGVRARLESMQVRIGRYIEWRERGERSELHERSGQSGLRGNGEQDDAADEEQGPEPGLFLPSSKSSKSKETATTGLSASTHAFTDEPVRSLPELEVHLEVAYPSADQLLGECAERSEAKPGELKWGGARRRRGEWKERGSGPSECRAKQIPGLGTDSVPYDLPRLDPQTTTASPARRTARVRATG